MSTRNDCLLRVLILAAACAGSAALADDPAEIHVTDGLRGALLSIDDATEKRIQTLKAGGTTGIVLSLPEAAGNVTPAEQKAVERIAAAGLELYYWIEVARCPELANAQPKWMASLQTHEEWRRLFPDAPAAGDDEVIKVYPWVPILSRETFDGQLQRVTALLSKRTDAKGVFLNDLQGAPSACGCGHPLCRWTSDYGRKRTTTALGPDAAALFVKAVQDSLPECAVIPVWATECEEHDGAADGLCAGVGCFNGICWKAWTEQLVPVARVSRRVGVLAAYREFQRDSKVYGGKAEWIRQAVEFFETMPRREGARGVEAARLVTVVQGWGVDDDDIAAQIAVATDSGVSGFVVAYSRIEQSWEPRLLKWR
ncbi:MAG: hypothetical protein R3C19_20115 [Planctomycetaceae bacterium]